MFSTDFSHFKHDNHSPILSPLPSGVRRGAQGDSEAHQAEVSSLPALIDRV